MAASINVSSHAKPTSEGTILDEIDSSNLKSILLVSDNLGHVFGYLDGTFPFGFISLESHAGFKSMVKHPSRPYFLGHVQANERTFLCPALIDFPLLAQRKSRDLAKLSSTARELVWYMLRIVKEMRSIWHGSESNTGARELGPKWVLSLETKQKEQFGRKEIVSLFARLTRPMEYFRDGAESHLGADLSAYHGTSLRAFIRFSWQRGSNERKGESLLSLLVLRSQFSSFRRAFKNGNPRYLKA